MGSTNGSGRADKRNTNIFLGTLISLVCAGFLYSTVYSKISNNLAKEVSIAADLYNPNPEKRDGVTSHEEWGIVYREVGMHYDVHASNPTKELTHTQMKRYLEAHPVENLD